MGERPRARRVPAPSTHHRVHPRPRRPRVGTSRRPPTPRSTHDTTRSTRSRASCATSPRRTRSRSPSCPSGIVARAGRCSRSRSRLLRRALPPAPVMGHTTRIRGRSCWTGRTGKGRRREAPGHAAGSSSRAHSTLERSVLFTYLHPHPSPLCLALSENGAHWFIAAVVGCLFFRVVHRTRPPSRPVGDIFSRPFT